MWSIISLLKGTLASDKVMPLEPTSTYAANTNNKKQLRFHSTKKKRESHFNRWSRPTVDEEISICSKLSATYVKFCGVCFKEDNGYTESPIIQWVECNIWLHQNRSINTNHSFCSSCAPQQLPQLQSSGTSHPPNFTQQVPQVQTPTSSPPANLTQQLLPAQACMSSSPDPLNPIQLLPQVQACPWTLPPDIIDRISQQNPPQS